jgi:hypothetical protein
LAEEEASTDDENGPEPVSANGTTRARRKHRVDQGAATGAPEEHTFDHKGQLVEWVVDRGTRRFSILKRGRGDNNEGMLMQAYGDALLEIKRLKVEAGRYKAIVALVQAASGIPPNAAAAAAPAAAPAAFGFGAGVIAARLAETSLVPHRKQQIGRLAYALRVVQTLASDDGQPFVPGPNGRGSLLPQFPHMVAASGRRKAGPPALYCSVGRILGAEVELVRASEDGVGLVRAEEEELLKIAREQFTASAWDALDECYKSFVVHLALEFADGPNAGRPVTRDAFKGTLTEGAAFKPSELPPYQKGSTEQLMYKGRVAFPALSLREVRSRDLQGENKAHACKYRIVARALNPWFGELPSFTAHSEPFFVKHTLHNDVVADERYVANADGEPTRV